MGEKANYREFTNKELISLKDELKSKMKDMRVEKVIGSNFNISEYKKAKKDIARINTILREQELGIGKAKEEK